MAEKLDLDLASMFEARQAARRAGEAQKQLNSLDAEGVDRILAAMAAAGQAAAAELARLTVEETGMGVYEHKVFKNRFASASLYEVIKPEKTVGVIWHDREKKLFGVAEPVGVIAAPVPVTGPAATVFFKSMIAMKGRNAIVFSPHPRAVKSTAAAAAVMNQAAIAAGAPADVIQCLEKVSLAATNELMRNPNVALILGTGGPAMVRAAYSAGKPAIAVGPGNVPSYVDESAEDLPSLAQKVIESKTFDNGTPCASEQALVVHKAVANQVKMELRRQGAHFLEPEEKDRLVKFLIGPDGGMNSGAVGKSAVVLAQMAGLHVSASCRALVAEVSEVGAKEPYSAEILAPVLAFYRVDTWQEGLARCNQILEHGGLGHSCSVWTTRDEVMAAFATGARAFRLLVNCPTAFGAMGHLTSLNPSFMLGTGSWGGSITSDNVGPHHLINVRRVAYGTRSSEKLSLNGG